MYYKATLHLIAVFVVKNFNLKNENIVTHLQQYFCYQKDPCQNQGYCYYFAKQEYLIQVNDQVLKAKSKIFWNQL